MTRKVTKDGEKVRREEKEKERQGRRREDSKGTAITAENGGHSISRCKGHSADRTDTSGAAASSGLGLLHVLGGGHSAEHGGASGAGIAACSSGFERLRRQACCNFRDLVSGFDSLSSHHVDRVRPRGVCGDGGTNSCCDTHGARANACSTLHDARGNSGEHVNSGGCTKKEAVEFGEEQSQGVCVLGTRSGVLLWRSLLLCSRRQEGCM